MNCADASNLLSAYADGETNMLQGHWVRRHLQDCPSCATAYDDMLALRARLRAEAPRHSAPAELRARVVATLDAVRASVPPPSPARAPGERWRWLSGGALAGCAATVLAWVFGTAMSFSIAGIGPKPVQFDPMPSAHATRIMFWIARLASDTPYGLSFSTRTTIANDASAA